MSELIVENLAFAYTGASRRSLDGVSFRLLSGQICVLVGANGSGKSTLLKVMAGVLTGAIEGGVRLGDAPLGSFAPSARARKVAYLPADLRAEFPLTALEAVALGRVSQRVRIFSPVSGRDRELIRQSMERCDCWGLRDRELSSLSGGERQIVAIARAFAQGSEFLLLDETLSRMDLHHQQAMGRLFKEFTASGGAVALVSHDINLASEWASHAIALESGRKIADGALREVLTAEILSRLYPGARLAVEASPYSGQPKVYFR